MTMFLEAIFEIIILQSSFSVYFIPFLCIFWCCHISLFLQFQISCHRLFETAAAGGGAQPGRGTDCKSSRNHFVSLSPRVRKTSVEERCIVYLLNIRQISEMIVTPSKIGQKVNIKWYKLRKLDNSWQVLMKKVEMFVRTPWCSKSQ